MVRWSGWRVLWLSTYSALVLGCVDSSDALDTQNTSLTPGFGAPLVGLSMDEQNRFALGAAAFAEDEDVNDGLGPVFNATSCVACHSVPVQGGFSPIFVTRFGRSLDGVFDPLAGEGGSLIQTQGIGRVGGCYFAGETVPADANVVAHRITTPLFGLGLVDELDEADFYARAADQASRFPDEAGVVSVVHDIAANRDAVGRFGWKAQVPTLHQFAGDAYLNEMGITNPEFPDESCPQGDCSPLVCNSAPGLNDDGTEVDALRDYMRLLAPPVQLPAGTQEARGHAVFARISCNRCHTESLTTGDSDVAALDHVELHPYSDFLLHNMGTLGDGIEQGHSTRVLMRTAPLWGMRARSSLLHDGRAHTPEQAILAHRGQGQRARDDYAALPSVDRADLIAFLKTL
jgi:CxxC motif-containing protein (DUF1111 family)